MAPKSVSGRVVKTRISSAAGNGESDLGAFGAADPVALHGQGGLGPVQLVQVVQQPVGVGGDPQQPLAHDPAIHGLAGLDDASFTSSLARPILRRAPVDGTSAS